MAWRQNHNARVKAASERRQNFANAAEAAQQRRNNLPEEKIPSDAWYQKNKKAILTKKTLSAGLTPDEEGLPTISSAQIEQALKQQTLAVKKHNKAAIDNLEKHTEIHDKWKNRETPTGDSIKLEWNEPHLFEVQKIDQNGKDRGYWPPTTSIEQTPDYKYEEVSEPELVDYARSETIAHLNLQSRLAGGNVRYDIIQERNDMVSNEEKQEVNDRYRAQPKQASREEFLNAHYKWTITKRETKYLDQKSNPYNSTVKLQRIRYEQISMNDKGDIVTKEKTTEAKTKAKTPGGYSIQTSEPRDIVLQLNPGEKPPETNADIVSDIVGFNSKYAFEDSSNYNRLLNKYSRWRKDRQLFQNAKSSFISESLNLGSKISSILDLVAEQYSFLIDADSINSLKESVKEHTGFTTEKYKPGPGQPNVISNEDRVKSSTAGAILENAIIREV